MSEERGYGGKKGSSSGGGDGGVRSRKERRVKGWREKKTTSFGYESSKQAHPLLIVCICHVRLVGEGEEEQEKDNERRKTSERERR